MHCTIRTSPLIIDLPIGRRPLLNTSMIIECKKLSLSPCYVYVIPKHASIASAYRRCRSPVLQIASTALPRNNLPERVVSVYISVLAERHDGSEHDCGLCRTCVFLKISQALPNIQLHLRIKYIIGAPVCQSSPLPSHPTPVHTMSVLSTWSCL